VRDLKLAVCMATLSLCSFTAWAQGTRQNVAPPPADLEPGVNTSATQPSSPEAAPAAAPVSTPKPAATPPKQARSGTATSSSPTAGGAAPDTAASASSATPPAKAAASASAPGNANTATAPSSVAGTTNGAPGATPSSVGAKPGRATTAAVPKTGASAGKAHDTLELDTTQITGNRELPKVLYIVPWKRSDLGDLVGKPVNSLVDEVLTPVDRDVFKRQNRYYDALKPDDAKDAAGAASDPASQKH
jgi:hypothetical protein